MKPVVGYLLILFGGLFITWVINSFFLSPLIAMAFVLGGAAVIFALDAFIAWVLHLLPEKYFDYKKKIFQVRSREKKFYEKIGIRAWKDKIPEMGQLCDFHKDKIASTEQKYIHKFLVETCYAEVIHVAMILIGLLIIPIIYFINPGYFWNFSFPLVIINTFLNLPPVLIQRYTRPKLLKLQERELRKQKETT